MDAQVFAGPVRLRDMQSLAERVSPATAYRHVGDLAWNWAVAAPAPTALWYGDGAVCAWAWLEPPDGAMVQVDPATPALADDVLDWVERALDRPLRIELAGSEAALVEAVTRRGYRVAGGPFMLSLRRDLAHLPTVDLPEGYSIRPLRGREEFVARVAVHGAAFGSTGLTAARYAELSTVYPYDRDLDVVVTAPDGQFAAYCQGWYDRENRIGEFEPVGTHPAYRRQGLASAVCVDMLHRFAARGGTRAVVYCRGDDAYPVPRRVYGGLRFTEVTRTAWYVAPPG